MKTEANVWENSRAAISFQLIENDRKLCNKHRSMLISQSNPLFVDLAVNTLKASCTLSLSVRYWPTQRVQEKLA